MERGFAAYDAFVRVAGQVLFWLAVLVALIALLDWLVRTRRVQPFGRLARFCRRWVDPLMAPIERRLVRRGGLPSHAPWWALGIVIVGGLLLLSLLGFLRGFASQLAFALTSPGRFGMALLGWTFWLLRIALIVRVVASWLQISPWSRWIRWSVVLTEWMLAPLRRVIPTLGPVDITPFVAFLLLALLQRALLIP